MAEDLQKELNFWRWLIASTHRESGLCLVINRWYALHATVGIGIATFSSKSLSEVGTSALMPILGILIGLAFAWAGNAQVLLQSEEIVLVSRKLPGGLTEFTNWYLLGVLVLLGTFTLWGFASLGLFDLVWPMTRRPVPYFLVSSGMYSLLSLSIRTAWQTILSARYMLLVQRKIRDELTNASVARRPKGFVPKRGPRSK